MDHATGVPTFDIPLAAIVPANLNKQASAESCGLFFPYGSGKPIGLAVDWDGETHLIHLDGPNLYHEGGIDIGHSIRGAVVSEIEFRVDAESRYNSGMEWDPAGALVVKDGQLFLYCLKLGDQFHDDPRPLPVGGGYRVGAADEACGFKKWSIAIHDCGRLKVLRTFEALPAR